MNVNLKKALVCLGYRNLDDKGWAKPVGHMVFTFRPAESDLSLWFTGANDGKPLLWARSEIAEEYRENLVSAEACMLSSASGHKGAWTGDYAFLSRLDSARLMLED